MRPSASLEANIWKNYLFHFFLNLQLWWPIWVIYVTEERGLTLGQVTLIDIPFWTSIILLQVPAAAIADRWGRKPTLVAAAAALSLAITVFGLATGFWLLLLSYLIWGVGFALLSGTESAFLYDTLKSVGREYEYAAVYGRAWALAAFAMLAGTLLGAPLAEATSLSFPIVLSGAIGGLAVITALFFVEPREHAAALPSYGDIIRESARIVRDRPAVRYSLLFFGLVTIGSIGPIFFFQPFLREHDIDVGQVGLWQTPMRIAAIAAAAAAGHILERFGERTAFFSMPAAIVASYALLALWDSTYAQAAFPVLNFVVVLSQPAITGYLNRRVPSEQRATVVSLTNLVRSLVLIPSAPLMGVLAEESLMAAFAAGAGIVLVAGAPLLLVWSPYLRGAQARGRAEPERLPAAAPD